MHLDYAVLCEFSTLSQNGLHSFMHVFDKTTFQKGVPMGLRGFLGVKLSDMPAEGELEVYMTNSANVVIDKGQLMKGNVKGPMTQVVFRIGMPIPQADVYTVWARVDGSEPVRLVQWTAEEKSV